MRVLQFAKRSVVTLALVTGSLAGCSGTSPDAPFNPTGMSGDLEAMNGTFSSPAFASFSTMSLMFDAALGGSPIISASAAALDIHSTSPQGIRAAAVRSAQRLTRALKQGRLGGFSASSAAHAGPGVAAVPAAVAGKTFIYDVGIAGYIPSDRSGAPGNGVRFILYAVDPVTLAIDPATEVGYVDLIDLSAGSTQAARVMVVFDDVTYVDYRVSASSTVSSGRVSVIGYVTDGNTQANVNLRSTITYSAGLTLTYSLDLPTRDVSIDLTVSANDIIQPTGTLNVNLLMRGPNGTVAIIGQFTDTTGNLAVRINGSSFATITTNGTTTTITRTDGTPLADDELIALEGVFAIQAGAFVSFDQMMAPLGAFFQ